MSMEIPSQFQPFIREQLRLGVFRSEDEVVAEALGLLKAEREATLEGIRNGLADAAAGRMQAVAETFADLRREFGLGEL
jgi:putative addiction module CopG family antidote